MKVKEMTRIALLAALLFIIYSSGSVMLYVELFNFTVLLYGVTLPRRQAVLAVLLVCLLIVFIYGVQLWTMMYVLIFPSYAFIYSWMGRRIKSEYGFAFLGFFLAFLSGTLIDLPFILLSGMAGKALVSHFLFGFQASLGNGMSTFLATLFLFAPLSKVIKRSLDPLH